MLKLQKYYISFIVVSIIIINVSILFIFINKNKFHEYYLFKNFLFGDTAFINLKNVNYLVTEKKKNYKNFNKDFKLTGPLDQNIFNLLS